MVEPFTLTVKLVKCVVDSSKQVKSNYEECSRLRRLAERTLLLVKEIQTKTVAEQCVSEALGYINEALEGAHAAIDDCCNTNCLCALLLYNAHSSALKQAAKELDCALSQMPLAALAMTSEIQEDLANLVDGRSHQKFDETVARAHQTMVLKKEIEKSVSQTKQAIVEESVKTNLIIAESSSRTDQLITESSSRTNQEIENIKNQLEQIMQKLELHSETIGVLLPTANLVSDISNAALSARKDKKECNILATAAMKVLGLLKTFEETVLSHSLVLEALHQVNDALATIKQYVEDCCATSGFFGIFGEQSYSLRLNEAMKVLGSALSRIPRTIEGVPSMMQSIFIDLCSEVDNVEFSRNIGLFAQEDDTRNEQPSDIAETSQPNQEDDRQLPLQLSTHQTSVDAIEVRLLLNITLINVSYELAIDDTVVGGQDDVEQSSMLVPTFGNSLETTEELDANSADVNFQANDEGTLLSAIAQNSSLDIVKAFIARGANVNSQDNDGLAPLYIAAQQNRMDIAKELIVNGANVNFQKEDGYSPLHIASQNGYVDVVMELIVNGADVNLQENNGWSPLYIASQNGHLNIVKELIVNGANINLQEEDGWSLLHIASRDGYVDIVKELINNGAEVNLQEESGCSPLYIASDKRHVDVVKELIVSGADVNLQNKRGSSPLYIASVNGHVDVVKELMAKGANVGIRTKKRDTPLHVAASYGRVQVVQVLLEHGASKKARNNKLRKPYHVVCTDRPWEPYEQGTFDELKSLLRR